MALPIKEGAGLSARQGGWLRKTGKGEREVCERQVPLEENSLPDMYTVYPPALPHLHRFLPALGCARRDGLQGAP